ncbi:cysteine desulfurase family protein [Schumannella luteola]|uniref:Cysteine desulfurase n=1 Tax=Schumannella luteola TaxID=472059 RepID=A0A852YD04_9MICO|nr:cysteine desulfurase family protein [Schumannella luteola]NYG99051.1 cysteine desulfurase [Schumannella luteola]TPX06406.1 cysteine desulfurase [Schumannella luteola]
MTVYLDHAATSPLRPVVLEAYTHALRTVGNPSSIHADGQRAREVLEEGREQVAASLGADPMEIVFTSGGTEAVNLGIKGLFWARNAGAGTGTGTGAVAGSGRAAVLPRPRIVVPRGEHHATIDSVEWLERHEGAELSWVELDAEGHIRLDDLERALGDGTDVALVTALWANNEVGTLQPVDEIVALAAAVGVPVHLDAIAAYGQVEVDAHRTGAAAISVSAHKIGGPVGVGALVLSRGWDVEALLHGGGQQRGRSGTQDAAGAAGFGTAAAVAAEILGAHAVQLAELRDRLIDGVIATVPGAVLRGPAPAASAAGSGSATATRLPGNVHFTFDGCEGDSLLMLLDLEGFSVSTGSACQAGVPEPSHVLLGMGVDPATARGALRFTLGPDSTADDIDALLAVLPGVVDRARSAGLAQRIPSLGR